MQYPSRDTVLMFVNDGMGNAPLELRHKLAKTYLTLLNTHEILPKAICFYTEGVRLCVTGSPVLDELRALEAKGVRLILCSTCLNFYGLSEQVAVGIVGGMTDIIESQFLADKVILL